MNKKGFELVWSTIVIVILSLMLLAFLLAFFFNTSGSFIGTIKSYFSYSNVDSIVSSCNILVDSGQDYSYCCEVRNVKYYDDGDKTEGDFTCSGFYELSIVNNLNELNCGGVSC